MDEALVPALMMHMLEKLTYILCRLGIFVWTFGGILFTPQDMLCRIKSRLIFKMNFFHIKCNESLGQLLKLHLKYYI